MSPVKIQFGKGRREKVLLSLLVAIAIIAVYFQILLRPVIGNLGTLLPKVSALKGDLTDARNLIAKKDVIEKEKNRLQLEMDGYGEVFPSQQEVPKLLENLSGIAAESGVRIIGIKPFRREGLGPKKKEEIYQELPIEIIAKSGYHQLGRFLEKLESGDRFIMVKDVQISADPYSIKRHSVRLIASTYILVIK